MRQRPPVKIIAGKRQSVTNDVLQSSTGLTFPIFANTIRRIHHEPIAICQAH
jgi:hypothetical protein